MATASHRFASSSVPRTLLLVEDDTELAGLMSAYLSRHGFRVNVVHDGRAGLSQAVSGAPDMVILDVMLPHLSGFDVLRYIRRRSRVPVIMGDGTRGARRPRRRPASGRRRLPAQAVRARRDAGAGGSGAEAHPASRHPPARSARGVRHLAQRQQSGRAARRTTRRPHARRDRHSRDADSARPAAPCRATRCRRS